MVRYISLAERVELNGKLMAARAMLFSLNTVPTAIIWTRLLGTYSQFYNVLQVQGRWLAHVAGDTDANLDGMGKVLLIVLKV